MLLIAGFLVGCAEEIPQSTYALVEEEPVAGAETARIAVDVFRQRQADREPEALPVRVVVRGSDGAYVDGGGHGLYDDGRFFAEGSFAVDVVPGPTRIDVSSGPDFVPQSIELEAEAGRAYRFQVDLAEWFSPVARGWYGGDNHVHAQHDRTAAVQTSLEYTALQARANGLSFVTEAGSNVSYDELERLSTHAFLLGYAPEIRPGPFVGHLNAPGIRRPIDPDRLDSLINRPLPAQAVKAEVQRLDGAVIHTHPLTPPQQLHWMGAAELFSDAVLGQTMHAMDLDRPVSFALWYTVLNLGNRMAASSYTDAALGRTHTLSPGDRRVYVKIDRLNFPDVAEAVRNGWTVATNGGPLFTILTLDGNPVGERVQLNEARQMTFHIKAFSLHPLNRVVLIRKGRVIHEVDAAGKTGRVERTHTVRVPAEPGWYVLYAEAEGGHWSVTSPIYVETSGAVEAAPASALLLQINNATRFIELRTDFFAHLIATVSPEDPIAAVELIRDSLVVHRFTPGDGDQRHDGQVPVTGPTGAYGPGWIWHPNPERPVHLQADWPVTESGWYAIRVTTAGGRREQSDAVYFDAAQPTSHQLSVAHLNGGDTRFTLHGYGEEMPLADIRTPFEGDHWWYPKNAFWRATAVFGDETRTYGSEHDSTAAGRFRRPSP